MPEQKKRQVRKVSKRSKRSKRRTRRIIVFTIEAIVLILVLLFGFLYSKYRKLNRTEIDEEKVTNSDLGEDTLVVMEGYTTFAIFGIDARDNKNLGKGNRSDVIMICNIDNATSEIRLVSVYRDTYLDVNGKEDFRKINAAYSLGGPEQALAALNQNLDMNITKFVTFNWKSVADTINILGGIDLEITKAEYGNGTTTGINGFIQATKEATGINSVHLKGPGMQHLDGIQAVAYARLRLMDTDFQRTERQRRVIDLTLQKAKQADLGMLLDSVDAVFPYILTNFTDGEIISLVSNITKYHIGATSGFPTENTGKRVAGQAVVVPADLVDNVKMLHGFLFENEDYQVSAAVQRRDQLIKQKIGSASSNSTRATTTAAATEAPTPEETTPEETLPVETLPEETLPTESVPGETGTGSSEVGSDGQGPTDSSTQPGESVSPSTGPGESTAPTGPTEAPSSSEVAPTEAPSTEPVTEAPTTPAPGPLDASTTP